MYFAGLDAHLRYVTVAVLDRFGTLVLETTVPTRSPERLVEALAAFRPLDVEARVGRAAAGREASPSGAGLSGGTDTAPNALRKLNR